MHGRPQHLYHTHVSLLSASAAVITKEPILSLSACPVALILASKEGLTWVEIV